MLRFLPYVVILMPLGSLLSNEIFEMEQTGRSTRQPSITLFIRMPGNWQADNDEPQIRGVLAFCTWNRESEDVRSNLAVKYTKFKDLGRFADANQLAIITWTTKRMHNTRKSYFELTKEEQGLYDGLFDDAADTWKRGIKRLGRKYNMPHENIMLFGISGGAQYAHRLAMRAPGYFSAVHIHVNSSYDRPTRDGANVLWLVTTGELEYGYPASKKFYEDCVAQGYHMIFKAGENLGHAGRKDIYGLGTAFFEYALKFIPDPTSDSPGEAPVDQFYLMKYPAYLGDYLNHQAFPVDKAKMIKGKHMVALPTKSLAHAWGPVFE